MGKIEISLKVEDEEAKLKLEAEEPNISDLSVALAQLELMKLNLIGKIAKNTKINKKSKVK